jgi:hypothetical protein
MLAKTRNPPTVCSCAKPQRVSFTDSFGASPVSSALDHSARRDPCRSDYHHSTQTEAFINHYFKHPIRALQTHTAAR